MKTTNRWRIAIAGVFLQIAPGAVYLWSVFRVPLSKQFGWSISELTLTFTISIFVLGLAAFFSGLWDFQEGDVGYVQKSLLHSNHNTGDTDLVFMEMFKSDRYQEFPFSEWLAHTPPELVMAHLNIDMATFDAIPKNGISVTPLS